jgi:threonine synthase
VGMKKALSQKLIAPEEPTVVINTGNGLKDIRAAMMAVKEAPVIEPTMSSLKKYLEKSK